MKLPSHLYKLDFILFFAAFCLVLFGIFELTGMSYNHETFAFQRNKQIIALILGIIMMYGISLLDYRFLKNSSYIVISLYIIGLVVLGILLFFGRQIRGTTGWFQFAGIALAPVEFVKIIIALLLAKYFSGRHIESYRFFHLAVSFIYIGIPFALVLMEPDFGSALVILFLWLGMLFFTGISKKHLVILLIVGVLVSLVSWNYLFVDYQRERILTFINPYHDPQGSGYNVIQSMIAIGNGGFFGKGLGYGSQVQFGFLPEAHTDFMFASTAEEFGFFGVLVILTLVGIICFRIMKISLEAHNNFARLFCVGFLLLIIIQVTINTGMNLGIMPVTGITFPFLSYGGSSLLSVFIGLGIVQSIKVRS